MLDLPAAYTCARDLVALPELAGLLLRHPQQVTLVEAAEAQEIDALAA